MWWCLVSVFLSFFFRCYTIIYIINFCWNYLYELFLVLLIVFIICIRLHSYGFFWISPMLDSFTLHWSSLCSFYVSFVIFLYFLTSFYLLIFLPTSLKYKRDIFPWNFLSVSPSTLTFRVNCMKKWMKLRLCMILIMTVMIFYVLRMCQIKGEKILLYRFWYIRKVLSILSFCSHSSQDVNQRIKYLIVLK